MSTQLELNERQRAAVAWQGGPVLVLAGPGSGKTTVLTLRVARLLQEQSDASVLALTFTNKAANEMRERVDALMGSHETRARLCTFHAFATDILRQHGSHIGLKPDFTLLTLDEDRVALLERALEGVDAGDSVIPDDRQNLLALLDRLFSDSYDGGVLDRAPAWLPWMFERYCATLAAANRMDFGALLYFAKRLLSTKPGVAQMLRFAWSHVCVDEFQDTNRAQYDLLRLIVGDDSPNLFVVADDDQLIYQWNGASPERLQTLRRDYQMAVIQLPENFRCPPVIIDLANNLIQHNLLRTPGKAPLVAHRRPPDGNVLWYYAFETPGEEAAGVAQSIRQRGLRPEQCVVLARTTRLLEGCAEALRSAGYEAHLVQRKTEFEAPAVRWMFNVVRLANARHDRGVLKRVCGGWADLMAVVMEPDDIVAASALVGGDFLRAWYERALLDAAASGEVLALVLQVGRALLERLDFLPLVQEFFDKAPAIWKDDLVLEETATWRELHEGILREDGPENTTLHQYLQLIALQSKASVPPPAAVRLLTIHGAKGLEFEHVFLIGMSEDTCPSFQATKQGPKGREMEEERRSCFVAITRVRETLYLSRARRYHPSYPKAPSRFLLEMGLEVA